MREPGDECPECGGVVRKNVCKSCGWRADSESKSSAKLCGSCGESFTFWTQLTPGEDGILRCAKCHMGYLERRAHGTTDATRCPEPGCGKTVGEHRAEFRALCEQMAAQLNARAAMLRREVKRNDLDRPAAAWDERERQERATRALDEFRRHLAALTNVSVMASES